MADASQQQVIDLAALAQARFGELSQAELKLLVAAPKGRTAFCGPSDIDDDPANDPAKADEWGPEREVRAGLIRWLCKDRDAASAVDPFGIQIHAARITGPLNLSFVTVPFPLLLRRCRLTDDASLISINLPALDFAGSRVESITADGAEVRGNVFLSDGFKAEGGVRVRSAQIGGTLNCRGGTFNNPGESALHADGAVLRGTIFLNDGFRAEGEVRLLAAQIRGNLSCGRGTFRNPGGRALSADGAKIEGAVFLRDRFSAEGQVRLLGAKIGGYLDCSGGRFSEMNAESAAIVGPLLWRSVEAAETTRLDLGDASAGSLSDDEASWPGRGNVVLDGLVYGHISGESPRDAETRLRWLKRQDPFKPQPYRQLAKVLREAGDDSGARKVLFEMERRRRQDEDLRRGREEERRRLEEEEQRRPEGTEEGRLPVLDLQRFRPLTTAAFRAYSHLRRRCARLWGWVLRLTIGYGIYPLRALGWLVLLWALCGGLFRHGYFSGAMAPTDKDAYHFFRDHGSAPDYYQRFTASIYSLENSLPFVNLGQKDHWTPDPNQQGWWRLASFLRGFRWFQVLFGWLLATLFVAGVTGVVRKE